MPNTVPAILEQAQTVAVGAFNPYVITPPWLVKFGICAREDESNVRMVPLGEGAAFEFGPAEWQVDGQRLSVSSVDRAVDCGDLVSRVLALLPHTPVRAVGHNFQFTATKAEWGGHPSPRLGRRGLDELEGADQVRWSGVFRRGDARLEVTLAHESEVVAVLFNFHRIMDMDMASAAATADGQIAQARDAAMKFRADFEHSRELLRSFFEMEMTHE